MGEAEDRSDLVAGFIDDELDERLRDEVERRVSRDLEWRDEYSSQAATRAQLRALEPPELSRAARGRLSAALRSHARDTSSERGDAGGEGALVIPLFAFEDPDDLDAPASAEEPTQGAPTGTRRGFLVAAALALAGGAAWYAASWLDERPPEVVRDVIARYQAAEQGKVRWGGSQEGELADEVAALGWSYHDLEDARGELSFVGFKATEIAGRRGLMVAYRRRGETVVQILLDQETFNTPKEIQDSVWRTGVWSSVSTPHTLVGWNDGKHSVVMVGPGDSDGLVEHRPKAVSYTHLRAHET